MQLSTHQSEMHHKRVPPYHNMYVTVDGPYWETQKQCQKRQCAHSQNRKSRTNPCHLRCQHEWTCREQNHLPIYALGHWLQEGFYLLPFFWSYKAKTLIFSKPNYLHKMPDNGKALIRSTDAFGYSKEQAQKKLPLHVYFTNQTCEEEVSWPTFI